MAERTGSLTRQFDRTCDVLEELGYLVPEAAPLVPADTEVVGAVDDVPVVTDDGRRLARIWSEADLLVAECLRAGVWRGLTPAELAAATSTLVFEAPRDTPGPPGIPRGCGPPPRSWGRWPTSRWSPTTDAGWPGSGRGRFCWWPSPWGRGWGAASRRPSSPPPRRPWSSRPAATPRACRPSPRARSRPRSGRCAASARGCRTWSSTTT